MKITGSGQIQSSSLKKSAKKQAAGGGTFTRSLGGGEKAESPSGVSGAGRLTPMDALLSLQEVPDSTDGRSKGLARAADMLDLLEDVRKGILLGSIPVSGLKNLAELARNHRKSNNAALKEDPKLKEILAEIELRAEVELAKLGL